TPRRSAALTGLTLSVPEGGDPTCRLNRDPRLRREQSALAFDRDLGPTTYTFDCISYCRGKTVGLNSALPFLSTFLSRSTRSKSTFAPASGTSTWAVHRIAFTTTRRKFSSAQLPWKWPPVKPNPRPLFGRSNAHAIVSISPLRLFVYAVVRVVSG